MSIFGCIICIFSGSKINTVSTRLLGTITNWIKSGTGVRGYLMNTLIWVVCRFRRYCYNVDKIVIEGIMLALALLHTEHGTVVACR